MSDKTATEVQDKDKKLTEKKEEDTKKDIKESDPKKDSNDAKKEDKKEDGKDSSESAVDGDKGGKDRNEESDLPADKDALIKMLVERLTEAEKQIKSTQELVAKQKEENEKMVNDLEKVNKEIQEELEKDQKELEEKVNKELKLTLQQSKDATEDAEKQEEILKAKLGEHETIITELESNLHDLRYEHKEVMVGTNQKRARNSQLETTVNHVKAQNTALEEHKKAKLDKLKVMEDEIDGIKKLFGDLDGSRSTLNRYLEGSNEDPATFMYYLESNEPKIQSDLTADYDEKTKTLNSSSKDIAKVKKFDDIQQETLANSPQVKKTTTSKNERNQASDSKKPRENTRYTEEIDIEGRGSQTKGRGKNGGNDFWGGDDDDEDIQMEYNFAKNLPNDEEEDVQYGSPLKKRAGAYETSPGGRQAKGTRQPKRVVAKNPR